MAGFELVTDYRPQGDQPGAIAGLVEGVHRGDTYQTLLGVTGSGKTFTMASFVVAATMMAGGIYFMEASFAAKGFYAMAAIMLVHTSITITKTLRDSEEASRFINRLEDAKTEKLLMEVSRSNEV